jgi:hypothetical protein
MSNTEPSLPRLAWCVSSSLSALLSDIAKSDPSRDTDTAPTIVVFSLLLLGTCWPPGNSAAELRTQVEETAAVTAVVKAAVRSSYSGHVLLWLAACDHGAGSSLHWQQALPRPIALIRVSFTAVDVAAVG